MPVYAIGDVQGCDAELGALLRRIGFKADRDRLWFTGDLVNRGPLSLAVLRRVHALRDNAVVTLGNHDLHLLALARSGADRPRAHDTLDEVLAAKDRDLLLDWLCGCPLLHHDPELDMSMVHAGLAPQWNLAQARKLAREVERALATDPTGLFEHMYGNRPDRWSEELAGYERLRFIVNCFTRMRFCTVEGRIDLKLKDAPGEVSAPYLPWFQVPGRRSRKQRIVFGHWSSLGLHRADNVFAIDTGCVWGGSLCALRLDEMSEPVTVGCAAHQALGL